MASRITDRLTPNVFASKCSVGSLCPGAMRPSLISRPICACWMSATTPGAAGIGEVLSAAVMSSYVPRELTPIYILIWRLILSYITVATGFVVFSGWVRRGLKSIDQGAIVEPV